MNLSLILINWGKRMSSCKKGLMHSSLKNLILQKIRDLAILTLQVTMMTLLRWTGFLESQTPITSNKLRIYSMRSSYLRKVTSYLNQGSPLTSRNLWPASKSLSSFLKTRILNVKLCWRKPSSRRTTLSESKVSMMSWAPSSLNRY